ncbi:MAG: prepilin-type N-terminal cleavage/methylation domain-containing protein [Pseudomonadota bacterium]
MKDILLPPTTLGCTTCHPRLARGSINIISDRVFCSRSPRKAGMTFFGLAGFTLVELSIVLVIIGLIVGGVMVGESLIHTYELRRVVSDINRFKTAINTFRLKYNALPGDMVDASTYWPNCYSNPSWCNGNGNGRLDSSSEYLRAWQQLTDSGILAGSYRGNSEIIVGSGDNVPAAGIGKGFYHLQSNETGIGTIRFSSYVTSNSTWWGAVVSPQSAFYIDQKLDNGKALSGNTQADNGSGTPTCLNGSWLNPNTTYLLTTQDIACQMFFDF